MQPKTGMPEVASALRRRILSGDLQPGDRLPAERRLSEAYGVARGTLRSALLRLEKEGLIDIRPGSGTYVTGRGADGVDPDPIRSTSPMELMEARMALEPHICRLAVLNGRAEDFDALDAITGSMAANLTDREAFAAADSAFHKRLAAATRNGLLTWLLSQMNAVRNQEEWKRMRRLTLDVDAMTACNDQHRAIVAALRARDADRAADLMRGHLETARRYLGRAA